MKLVLFIYDFPHKKSLKGMQLIKSKGIEDVYVIASPKVELKFRQSKHRVSVFETEIIEPSKLANQYGWNSLVENHNSEAVISFLKKIKPSHGIILGARILNKNVIDCFSSGIINFHPGVLPENRGLDNLKWAIYNNLPQGVTTHFIDENIDVGYEIYKELLEVDVSDTLFDINSKLFDLQMEQLNKLIENNFDIVNLKSLVTKNPSQKAVSDEIDEKIIIAFEDYKKQYHNILKNYTSV